MGFEVKIKIIVVTHLTQSPGKWDGAVHAGAPQFRWSEVLPSTHGLEDVVLRMDGS